MKNIVLLTIPFIASFLIGSEENCAHKKRLFIVNTLYPISNLMEYFLPEEQPLTKNDILCVERYRKSLATEAEIEEFQKNQTAFMYTSDDKHLPLKKRYKKCLPLVTF